MGQAGKKEQLGRVCSCSKTFLNKQTLALEFQGKAVPEDPK